MLMVYRSLLYKIRPDMCSMFPALHLEYTYKCKRQILAFRSDGKHRSYIIVTLRLHARIHLYYTLAASLFHGIKPQMQLWKGLIAPYFLKCARRLNIMYWAICIDDSAPLPSPPSLPAVR